jgi:hypothetical protein
MSGRIPIGSAILMTLGITTLGYGIMACSSNSLSLTHSLILTLSLTDDRNTHCVLFLGTTPTEKEFYDALSPDLKKKVDEQRRLTQGAREQLARDSQSRLDAIKVNHLSLSIFNSGKLIRCLIARAGSSTK